MAASGLARWASLGLATGSAGAGQSGSGLRARPIRIGFVFFEFIFNAKTMPEKLEIV
jgi:hypothetical protein